MGTETTEAYAFFDKHGMDVDLIGRSEEVAKQKALEAHMGWRYKYPEKCDREEHWNRIVESGGSIRKVRIEELDCCGE